MANVICNMHFTGILVVFGSLVENVGRLRVVGSFGHFLEGVPGRDGAKSAFHVGGDNLEAVNVGGVHPAKSGERISQRWD